jgi:hypothetical protein
MRVIETDINGVPLAGASIDRWFYGSTLNVEDQTLYIVGNPSGLSGEIPDYFFITWTDPANIPGSGILRTQAIEFFDPLTSAPITAAQIQASIQTSAIAAGVANPSLYRNMIITQEVRNPINVTNPILSYIVTYGTPGTPVLPVIENHVTASEYGYNTDFFLLDDQLPQLPIGMDVGDTLPGLIIRTRAQNTWDRPGLG